MHGHHAVLINDQLEARRIMEEIGASPEGTWEMIPKAVFRCIRLKNIPHQAANIIKQEMLSKGGEAALARQALDNSGSSDVLLLGTLKHYRLLNAKLIRQPFGLPAIAREIEAILANLEIKNWELPLAQGGSLAVGAKTLIMGILNITPDSFSDGGRFFDAGRAVEHALQMAADGADIIDVGGASSRPDSVMTDEEEELRRVMSVIPQLVRQGVTVAVDTFRARVAEQTLAAGVQIINNIGGFVLDPQLLPVLVKWQAPLVLMHNRMQIKEASAYNELVADICLDLRRSMVQAEEAGLGAERIIIDPGLGFGLNPDQNLLVLRRLQDFRSLGRPILVGASRKRFIGRTLESEDPTDRLEGSLAAAVAAIMNGAAIVRVHDVKETSRAARLTDAVRWSRG